jgi:MYXO-CTERM domain-containing protein
MFMKNRSRLNALCRSRVSRDGWSVLLVAALGGIVVAALPGTAAACGGFFCNRPIDPQDQPVAQTAENVLFAMDRDPSGQFKLEAHVQIFYTGPADKFSWVVPVDSKPTLDVGSNAVFTALLGATQPTFGVNWTTVGVCKDEGRPSPTVPGSGGTGGNGGSSGAADAGANGGVSVAFRGDVGPYDASVIKSTDRNDPRPLIDWLNENQYYVSPEATQLIADYVAQDKYFVAIRLRSGSGVKEIQPLVMRFIGPGPCVPLRLTSIAAIRDLKVNLWVLAADRVVPDNYFEIEINQARLDWFNGGQNYDELVKEAADQAGGNAFVTEYVGPTSMLATKLYQPGRYNVDLIRTAATPPDAMEQLIRQGFSANSTLLNVLRVHIPVPAVVTQMGITEQAFYNNLRSYWQQYRTAFAPFDPQAFATELEAKLITPLRKAQELIDAHNKLTRLSTFISPEEMLVDPTFVMNASLPDVPAQRAAEASLVCGDRQFSACDAPVRLAVPDGQVLWFQPEAAPVCYGSAFSYQRGQIDAMPALATGWARSAAGAGNRRFDNTATIRQAVTEQNTRVADQYRDTPGVVPYPGGGCSCSVPAGGAGQGLSGGAFLLGLAALLLWRQRRRDASSQTGSPAIRHSGRR